MLGAARRTARGRRLVQALRPCAVAGPSCDRALQRGVSQDSARSRGVSWARGARPRQSVQRTRRTLARTLAAAVRWLHRDGTSVVVATASEEEILPSVTHVLLLDRGRVVDSGRRQDVLSGESFERVMRRGSRVSSRSASPRRRSRTRPKDDHATPVVELSDVGLRYGGTRVLGGIDWVVRRGGS